MATISPSRLTATLWIRRLGVALMPAVVACVISLIFYKSPMPPLTAWPTRCGWRHATGPGQRSC